MIKFDQIKGYFSPALQNNPVQKKYLVKEYLLLLILDYLSGTRYIQKLVFIGGTNLRLIKGIDRFSEDLDFDCQDFSAEQFNQMTDEVISFLRQSGWNAEARDKESNKLSAFRRSIYFPGLLYDLGLSGHQEEQFLIKIEAEDQKLNYSSSMTGISGCGFFFLFRVPNDRVLLAMKLSALLSRAKGRDFYDVMFLMSQTTPDYDVLAQRTGIGSAAELKAALLELSENTDLQHKSKDFKHLLFSVGKSSRIEHFGEFIKSQTW